MKNKYNTFDLTIANSTIIIAINMNTIDTILRSNNDRKAIAIDIIILISTTYTINILIDRVYETNRLIGLLLMMMIFSFLY